MRLCHLPLFAFCFTVPAAFAQQSPPITLAVDLTDAPRKLLHARLSFPVAAGPLALVFPEWIPGEHGPTGPIDNLAGIAFSVNGQPVPWVRDNVNMFALHLNIPSGATTLDAKLDFLATAAATGFSAGASTSANLCPSGWHSGTALTVSGHTGDTTQFETVTLERLVDSPVLSGRFFKEYPLAPEVTPKHFLDMAADGPEDLNLGRDELEAFSNLVRETGLLYASRHYDGYHFLVTLSDNVAHFGLEHHQSSDDRVGARTFLDEDLQMLEGDLLPHEFTHSWNGKYRRPAGLATANYQLPMKGDLLWVYEGLTQYLGDVLATRSGIWTPAQYRSYLASSAAELDHRPGRTWRDLQDTATAAQTLYSTSDQWDNWRRSVDYYSEGELIWLEVDTTIRQLSQGRKSLNDFCARFLGLGGNTPPKVVPYTFEDVVSNLNAIQPHDWAQFFEQRLTSKSPHAPFGGIANGGYRVENTGQDTEMLRAEDGRDHSLNSWYSLGLKIGGDMTITDVLIDSPAFAAGLGPTMKIVAVNGRRADDELLHHAIRDGKTSKEPIELIIDNTGFFKTVKIDYHGGEKYPHLVRDPNQAALLDDILKPMSKRPVERAAE